MRKFIVFILVFSGLSFISQEVTEPIVMSDSAVFSEEGKAIEEPVFISQEIPNNIYEKMIGRSIPIEYKSKVNRNSLSYLKITYIGFDGEEHIGEMITSARLANEVLDIFKELYKIRYPIERISLIDEYEANDELSMSNNNTSCFCYRVINGGKSLSNHALGTAIDINPLYNPYVKNSFVSPASSTAYSDREIEFEHKISKNDEIYDIFISRGWTWGGDWKSPKDYQHFEKNI